VKIRFDPAPIKQSRASGHLLRFGIGGAVTVCAALIAKVWGPGVGGLSLAMPAILPIGIALIAKLQDEKVGPTALGDRARRAAVIEATGASIGGLGLIVFAVLGWLLLDRWPAWLTLAVATAAWAAVASTTWLARKAWSQALDRR
jgi:hypothetical protein